MKGICTEILSKEGKNSTPAMIFLDFFLMNTWLFYHSRYCRPVTHLYISILSSFLNVKFIKLLFSTSCPFHFPYLLLVLLLYPANHQQAGLGLCKASRDNPEWKRSNIKLLLCSHVLQVLQSKDVLYQDTLASMLHLPQVSSLSSVLELLSCL